MEKGANHPVLTHKRTIGQKSADALTRLAGSWTFIIVFIIFLLIWMAINAWAAIEKWDPYPFILLNLVLSCIAALQAPIILMSQNREAQRDRIRAEYDYKVNVKAEKEIENIQKQLDKIERKINSK
ncbi:DUF1003 domain-containing protein [Candidatus Pacearchaeota archaeon]|nr:DUF1003 domain-containing protein [Candidatus Pacearchaeota archaeon]